MSAEDVQIKNNLTMQLTKATGTIILYLCPLGDEVKKVIFAYIK